jgi:hypothetical protein
LARSTDQEGQYLHNGFSEFFKQTSEDKKPIDYFFGLESLGKRGNRSGVTKIQKERRNKVFMAAIRLLQKQSGYSPYLACKALSPENGTVSQCATEEITEGEPLS